MSVNRAVYIPLYMNTTPFFPSWRHRLGPMVGRAAKTLDRIRQCTLAQLEHRLAACVPERLFGKAAGKLNSRERIYTPRRTFWCFLWQCLNPRSPCREVVRQLQALFELHGAPGLSEADGAYVMARKRLPVDDLRQALESSAAAAGQCAPEGSGFLRGRPVKLVDGTTVTLPDTLANQAAFPQPKSLEPGCGFPIVRLVVLFCLAGGAILSMLHANLHAAEMRLFERLVEMLKAGDILIADRGFGNFVAIALLRARQVDFIARSARQNLGRRLRRLGKNDWLVEWKKGPGASKMLCAEQQAALPEVMTLRLVRGRIWRKGFRVRRVTLVTTLLDPVIYPAEELLRAYLRRWRLEMCIDDIKTTMGMEMLRCKSPEMIEKELLTHLIAHNMIRWIIAQAAFEHPVALEQISFKGAVDALRQFSQAMCQTSSARKRRRLWQTLLRTLAADLLPHRPGRREPRAVKRKKNKYQRLNRPRHLFRDRPKRNIRTQRARIRRRALN